MKKLMTLNPRVKILSDFYVFDVETGIRDKNDPNKIEWVLNARPESFIFGVIYGLNYTKIIHSLKELHETLLENRFKKRKVFAHNATYDLTTSYGNIFTLDPNAIFNGSRFISCTNGNCIFADSMNIFVGQSVKTIGKQIGILKKGMSGGNYTNSDWNNEAEKTRDINGCIVDCQIIWEALISTFEFASDIKITQASLSMSYYRRFHQPFHIYHNPNAMEFWSSYYGGRCEAFIKRKTHSVVYDVNSMYPRAMRDAIFPNPKYLKSEENFNIKKFINQILPHYEGCIFAEVSHQYHKIGHLPYKAESGKLLFPIGRFKGCWNFNEIRYPLEQGVIEITKINKVVYAEPMQSPFISYVDTLFRLKLEAEISGNEFERDRYKRFANSLYGKFAQRIDEESIYIENIEKQIDVIQDYQRKGLFKKLSMFNASRLDAFLIVGTGKKMDISYCIPSFASYITSFARVVLLKELVRNLDFVPVYCDTDSIFYEIDPNFPSSNILGEWKKENKIVTEIRGLKNYRFIDYDKSPIEQSKIKGVPKNVVKENGENSVNKIGENSYEYFNLTKTKEALRRNKEAGVLIKRVKTISNKYDKRIVLIDGETKPLEIC